MSLEIVNNCLSLPLWDALVFHLFLPIEKQCEIDTSLLLTLLQGKDKQIVLSKRVPDNDLAHFLLTDDTRIAVGKWGIPEPEGGLAVQPDQIQVVFVPLLIFDHKGHRIGYGKGYYDRFLSKCPKDTLKVGLSFFEPIDEIKELDQHDIPLDMCVTPKQCYTF